MGFEATNHKILPACILPTYAQVRLWELSRAVRDARFLAGGIDGPHSSQTKSLFI